MLTNPDYLAQAFISPDERRNCLALGPAALAELRAKPFCYFLLARTRFYDQLVLGAVASSTRRIAILGAGFDSRFHRFGGHLADFGAELLECDRAEALPAKIALASSLPHADRVAYRGVDLNKSETWPVLHRWLGASADPCPVMAEGVSPYVETSVFREFLTALKPCLALGSRLVYDFKIAGVYDRFGVSSDVSHPFRLPVELPRVESFHDDLGLEDITVLSAPQLMQRFAPG